MNINKNPFLEKCLDCEDNIWEILQNESKNNEIASNATIVKIEKYEDDNIS